MSALNLARRARVADLVGVAERREASGVIVRDGLLLVAPTTPVRSRSWIPA